MFLYRNPRNLNLFNVMTLRTGQVREVSLSRIRRRSVEPRIMYALQRYEATVRYGLWLV